MERGQLVRHIQRVANACAPGVHRLLCIRPEGVKENAGCSSRKQNVPKTHGWKDNRRGHLSANAVSALTRARREMCKPFRQNNSLPEASQSRNMGEIAIELADTY